MNQWRKICIILLTPILCDFVNQCHGSQLVGVEENPEYTPVDSDVARNPGSSPKSEESDDDYDEYYDEVSDEDEDDEKSLLNTALGRTNSGTRKTLDYISKHRAEITLACAFFAFRKEIYQIVLAATTVVVDGKRYVRFQTSPTSILKIILFIDFVRKMQNSSYPSSTGLSKGSFGLIFSEILKPQNNAFIPPIEQHYTFEKLNDRYLKDSTAFKKSIIEETTHGRQSFLRLSSPTHTTTTRGIENNLAHNKTTIVIDMKIDQTVSSMESIRDQVSFILYQHRLNQKLAHVDLNQSLSNVTSDLNLLEKEMEVIVTLESPGGSASDYGLASQHLARLRNEPGIKLTVIVDKVAASGGYMMACMSSPGHLYAAPFAIVGSIGVIGQTLNIHKSLVNFGVQPLVFRGGKDKAPVGLVGEVTKEGVAKVQSMVDTTHKAFKTHVLTARPQLADKIDSVTTGDVWLGTDAIHVGLIDRIITSDEYIGDKIHHGERVLKLVRYQKPRFSWGHPLYGSGFAHSSLRHLIDTFAQFRAVLNRVNQVLEELPPTCSNDLSGICVARTFGMNQLLSSTAIK